MQLISMVVLVATAIVATLNLLIEIEDRQTIKHEFFLKVTFGGIAVFAMLGLYFKMHLFYVLVNFGFLITLIIRVLNRKKQ